MIAHTRLFKHLPDDLPDVSEIFIWCTGHNGIPNRYVVCFRCSSSWAGELFYLVEVFFSPEGLFPEGVCTTVRYLPEFCPLQGGKSIFKDGPLILVIEHLPCLPFGCLEGVLVKRSPDSFCGIFKVSPGNPDVHHGILTFLLSRICHYRDKVTHCTKFCLADQGLDIGAYITPRSA